MDGTLDVAVRRRSRRRRPRRTFPDRLHIVSFSFRRDRPHPRQATMLVRGTMGQDEAMRVAQRRARALGPEPWLCDVNTVPPPRPTPALDAITRKHTAFPTFMALLTTAAGHYPSIRLDPMGARRPGARASLRHSAGQVGRPPPRLRQRRSAAATARGRVMSAALL